MIFLSPGRSETKTKEQEETKKKKTELKFYQEDTNNNKKRSLQPKNRRNKDSLRNRSQPQTEDQHVNTSFNQHSRPAKPYSQNIVENYHVVNPRFATYINL